MGKERENIWFINEDGNVVEKYSAYMVHKNTLGNNDWILHLLQKNWIDFNKFIPVYIEACVRAGIYNINILTTYDEKPQLV